MKTDKKNLILQAACAAFTENGYEKTSIENISRRAGVAQGLARYHFGNKETLYFEALLFVMGGLRNRLQGDIDDQNDMREAVTQFVRSYMDHTSDPSTGYAMVYREPPFAMLGNSEHMSALAELSLEIVRILARKMSPQMDSDKALRLATFVVTSLHGVQRARFSPLYRELVDIEELAIFFADAVKESAEKSSESQARTRQSHSNHERSLT